MFGLFHSASFFSRNSIFLSQQFSQNNVFQPVSTKFQTSEQDLSERCQRDHAALHLRPTAMQVSLRPRVDRFIRPSRSPIRKISVESLWSLAWSAPSQPVRRPERTAACCKSQPADGCFTCYSSGSRTQTNSGNVASIVFLLVAMIHVKRRSIDQRTQSRKRSEKATGGEMKSPAVE